jgi:hypothetical protein
MLEVRVVLQLFYFYRKAQLAYVSIQLHLSLSDRILP